MLFRPRAGALVTVDDVTADDIVTDDDCVADAGGGTDVGGSILLDPDWLTTTLVIVAYIQGICCLFVESFLCNLCTYTYAHMG